MGWRDAADYAFLAGLGREGWAWQFLRRDPGYRADYRWFIGTWQALEADYGAPPHRDFFRWKQDPRAWRPESEIAGCAGDACAVEGDRVLIECWMGAKWGLRGFPPDPERVQPVVGEELAWREQAVTVAEWDGATALQPAPAMLTLSFDLSRPLAAQLEAAKIRLVGRQRALSRAGKLPPMRIAAGVPLWTNWLRLLDGLDAGASLQEAGALLGLTEPARELEQARQMAGSGYRRILLLD